MLEARKRKPAGPERRFRLTDRSILTRTLGPLTHTSTLLIEGPVSHPPVGRSTKG
jgi:hypothetical protein